MLRIFIGADSRQPVAFSVLAHSLYKHSSAPIAITRLDIDTLPITRRGLTDFTFARYLVPWLCNYEGVALFMDADMLCRCDINELKFSLEDFKGASVAVVNEIERFEWPSLMLFNNPKCTKLTPEYIETGKPQTLEWAESLAALPKEYNHVVPYSGTNPDAKIVHFTQGIPMFRETLECEHSDEWRAMNNDMRRSCGWSDLMGSSVHAQRMGLCAQ
jgi:hypothetical protein